MNGRIIEISTEGRYLHADRGFLVIADGKEEVGRVPLDQVDAVIGNAHGLKYSSELLVRLSESAKPLVFINRQHRPVAILLALEGNHRQGARMKAQARLSEQKRQRIWKAIVQSKLRGQARTAEAFGKTGTRLRRLATEVKAGDSTNCEAQGARMYWTSLFGTDFRRDPDGDGTNALLNYGYTVLRSAVSRAIVASGLHPGLGLHHSSEFNGSPLADDLMEPFRPLFDACVKSLVDSGTNGICPQSKRILALCLYRSVATDIGHSPVGTAVERLAVSFAQFLEGDRRSIELPGELTPDALRHLGNLEGPAL